jgi:hypothetical protein
MLFSGLPPAIFISLGNAVARRCNLFGIFWFHRLGMCSRCSEYESPNRNTQKQRPHHQSPIAVITVLSDMNPINLR